MKVYPPSVAVNIVTKDGSYSPEILQWLDHMQVPRSNIEAKVFTNRDVSVGHNATLYGCMARAKAAGQEWCLLIEGDVKPIIGESDVLFTAPYNLTCVKCATRNTEGSWSQPDAFHAQMWIARVSDLEKIAQPAFHWITTPDGAEITGCICAFLAMQAREVGLTTGHVGWATHVPSPLL